MASAPQAQLPIFYNELIPLNSRDHAGWKSRAIDKAPWVAKQHAIPLTVEEFPAAQRHYPIVFSSGENAVPLALMGLNEGVNVFFEEDGNLIGTPYIPAYIRRYPFLLAKLDPSAENLSLCFDPQSGLVGEFEEGTALFDDEQKPSEHTQNLLQFCQNFENAGARTQAFMQEIAKAELLMDGEVAIQRSDNPDKPYLYRGFQMVNQEKLKQVRGDQLRKWAESGLLALLYAHMFSLELMRDIFARQQSQGKGPQQPEGSAGTEAVPAPANS